MFYSSSTMSPQRVLSETLKVIDETLIIVFIFFSLLSCRLAGAYEVCWWPLSHSTLCSYLLSATLVPYWTRISLHLLICHLTNFPAVLEKTSFLNYSTLILYSLSLVFCRTFSLLEGFSFSVSTYELLLPRAQLKLASLNQFRKTPARNYCFSRIL